nr:recombinase family protein [Clostridia bacterium]
SVDDGIAASDSVSIQNQRAIITDFVNKKGWHIENYYIDDGYSGTNFDCPGFKEMIHDIESRKKKKNTVFV